MSQYVAHFRADNGDVFGVLAQCKTKGLDSDSASESLISMLELATKWSRWNEIIAITIRNIGENATFAITGPDEVLTAWTERVTSRQKADWKPVSSRAEFDAVCKDDTGWSPSTIVQKRRGYFVPDFSVCDDAFRDRALFDEAAALIHFVPMALTASEFRAALTNLRDLETSSAFGEAHRSRLKALIDRPLTNLIGCAFLTPDPEGSADGLVYEREAVFPAFPHDAYCQSIPLTEWRRKASTWFSPGVFGQSESVMSRLGKVEARLEEMGRARYLATNLRRAFDIHQAGVDEAATKARRIAESIAVRVLRAESGKRVSKPFKDVIESLAQLPHTRVPPNIVTHLDGVRRIGNRGAHTDALQPPEVNAHDVEVALLHVLIVVEWYLFDYDRVVA